jgi:hypothetical protein
MLLLHGAMLVAPMVLLLAHIRFHVNGVGVCVVRSLLGVDCPGCGITRSVMALFAGDICRALRLHPAGPFVVALIVLMVTYLVLVLFTKFKGLEWRKEVRAFTGIEMLAFAALLTGWIGRVFTN